MTILVGSDIPGLVSALEQALGGSRRLMVVRDADTILAIIKDPSRRVDALILNDGVAPPAHTDIATALWDITSYVARTRRPTIPTVMTLGDDTPVAVYEALRAEAQQTGGDLHLVPRSIRSPEQPEAQQAVASITAHLRLESERRRFTIVAMSGAGGSGVSSTTINLSLQLARLGLRVLFVEGERSGSAANTWLGVQHTSQDNTTGWSKQEVERQISHHHSGLDVLFAERCMGDLRDAYQSSLDGLLDVLAGLNYDVVSFDGVRNQPERPDIVALLSQPTSSPLIICPPGVKERTAALATLRTLSAIDCGNGRTALDAAVVVFVEGERGQMTEIDRVKRDVLQQFPMVTDLGTLPRDPALLSLALERSEFCSVFDLAPQRPYCHAIRSAARRWVQAVDLPATWLTRFDPDERLARKGFWPLRRERITKFRKTTKITSRPVALPISDVSPLPCNVEQHTEVTRGLHTLFDAPESEVAIEPVLASPLQDSGDVTDGDVPLRNAPNGTSTDEEVGELAARITAALDKRDLAQALTLHEAPPTLLVAQRRVDHPLWQEVTARLHEVQAMVAACETALAHAHQHRQSGDLGRALDLLRPFDAQTLPSALARTLLTARCALLNERVKGHEQVISQQHTDVTELAVAQEQLDRLNQHQEQSSTSMLAQAPDGTVQEASASTPPTIGWLQTARQHHRTRTRLGRGTPEQQE